MKREEGGWTNLEAMTALLMAVVAFGSLAAAAVQSTMGAARIRERAAAVIDERNRESDGILELLAR